MQEHQAAPGEKAIKRAPQQASAQLERMRGDTYLGMAFSNVIVLFIILDTAAVLRAHGITDIPVADGTLGHMLHGETDACLSFDAFKSDTKVKTLENARQTRIGDEENQLMMVAAVAERYRRLMN